MRNYTLEEIASAVNGKVYGDPRAVINGVEIDSRDAREGEIFVPFKGARVNGHSFVRGLCERGIASFWQQGEEGRPEGNIIEVDDTLKAIQKLAAHYRQSLNCRIIGVTGSSGKTSTKDMLSAVLAEKYRVHKTFGNKNNEIGVPLTILSIEDRDEIAVVEMGISDFGEMDDLVDIVRPDYTVVTSIAPAHIMNFLTLDNIAAQKARINRDLKYGSCVYNGEAYGLKKAIKSYDIRSFSYGYQEDCDWQIRDVEMHEAGMSFRIRGIDETFSLPVLGRHQVLNAAASIILALDFGLTAGEINKAFSKLQLTPHRHQLRKIREATVIDDCYNSNPGSLCAALELLSDYDERWHKTAVLGDMLELGPDSGRMHAAIAERIDFSRFENTLLFGEEMRNLHEKLNSQNIPNRWFADRQELKNEVEKLLKPCSIILFKASNGMKFIDLINELEGSL